MNVVLWDINEENMDKVAEEIKSINGQVHSYVCDVTNKDEVYQTASKVKDVDILINNAGIVIGKNFLSCSDKDIERTINVNLMAHFWVSCLLSCEITVLTMWSSCLQKQNLGFPLSIPHYTTISTMVTTTSQAYHTSAITIKIMTIIITMTKIISINRSPWLPSQHHLNDQHHNK